MNRKIFANPATRALVLAAALGLVGAAQAQGSKTPYPKMAASAQYLMSEQNAEVALARTAAPESISRHATVLALKQHGYETAVKGTNGFVCIVDRSWMSPYDFPEFWNPKIRSPTCFNPAAVRSVLPYTIKRTEMVLAGLSQTQTIQRLRNAVQNKELPPLEPGAMCYMMSHDMYLGDTQGHWHPHLMFFSPRSDGTDWGANLEGSPVFLDPLSLSANFTEPFNVFMVPVWKWSDGTPAPIKG